MPGFFISSYRRLNVPNNEYQANCIKDELSSSGYVVQRNTLNKFLGDKVFYEDDGCILITEGVILNKAELCKQYSSLDFPQVLLEMRRDKGEYFFESLRGSFSGAILDKANDEWLIFTDHIGRPVYWYADESGFIVGSELNYISNSLKTLGIERQPELAAFKYMLTYGWPLDHRSCIKNVFRLLPGHCMTIRNGVISTSIYHMMNNTPDYNITTDEAIEKLDELFTRTMTRILDKEREYGYRTILDLSGGMDSRAVCFAAAQLGAGDALAFCFGQTGCYDQIISQEVAAHLKLDYIFYAIDNASHLYDIDQLIRMNNASCYYAGTGGYKKFLETLDASSFGMAVNGIFGDIYEGGHIFKNTDDGYQPVCVNERKKCLSRLLELELDESCASDCDNIEMFLSYKRDMLGNMNTAIVKRNFLEAISPFSDIDFLSYFYSIPRKLRMEDKVCVLWQRKNTLIQ